jgi:hypothetical protein
VAVLDLDGKIVKSANNPVTLSLFIGEALNGTVKVTPSEGLATFTNPPQL